MHTFRPTQISSTQERLKRSTILTLQDADTAHLGRISTVGEIRDHLHRRLDVGKFYKRLVFVAADVELSLHKPAKRGTKIDQLFLSDLIRKVADVQDLIATSSISAQHSPSVAGSSTQHSEALYPEETCIALSQVAGGSWPTAVWGTVPKDQRPGLAVYITLTRRACSSCQIQLLGHSSFLCSQAGAGLAFEGGWEDRFPESAILQARGKLTPARTVLAIWAYKMLPFGSSSCPDEHDPIEQDPYDIAAACPSRTSLKRERS